MTRDTFDPAAIAMSMNDDELPASAPRPGDVFADRYRIDRLLGVGGMGYVLAATHLHLQERVAIKMLLPSLVMDSQTVERFIREGRAAVKIRSEHVARILDVGELADRTPYIVMEYLDGSDLSQIVRDRGSVPFDKAIDWVLQACEAIAEAHAMRIVHRDLKPANMFLARRPNGTELVKVLDFGISKMSGIEGNMAMTKTSAMLGSPLYMSPEQLRSSRNVDERADIWAIGVILYELMSGGPPFMAESLAELGALVLSGDAPRLSDAAPDVPQGLSDVVATCLQKKLDDRFVNLADLADALAPFGGPSALTSTQTIVRTLGLPPKRASIVKHPSSRTLHEASLARTQQMHDSHAGSDSGSGSGRWLAATPPPSSGHNMFGGGTPSPTSSPIAGYGVTQPEAPARQKSHAGTVVLALVSALLILGATGGYFLFYKLRSSKQHIEATTSSLPSSAMSATTTPTAMTSSSSSDVVAPSSSANGAGVGIAASAKVVASATPSASASQIAVAKTKPNARPNTNATTTTTTTTASASTAAAAQPTTTTTKPSSPSGIATSSKD